MGVLPFGRGEAVEAGLRGGRRVSGEGLFEIENCFDLSGGGEELVWAAGEIYFGADAESFAGVAGHGLLDGAVVLDPLEPRGLPDAREMDGSGVGGGGG